MYLDQPIRAPYASSNYMTMSLRKLHRRWPNHLTTIRGPQFSSHTFVDITLVELTGPPSHATQELLGIYTKDLQAPLTVCGSNESYVEAKHIVYMLKDARLPVLSQRGVRIVWDLRNRTIAHKKQSRCLFKGLKYIDRFIPTSKNVVYAFEDSECEELLGSLPSIIQ